MANSMVITNIVQITSHGLCSRSFMWPGINWLVFTSDYPCNCSMSLKKTIIVGLGIHKNNRDHEIYHRPW